MHATQSPPRLKKLSRAFYLRPTLTVAKDLLGKYLCRRKGNDILIGRIVEVEAYLGEKDPASHAYRGRTRRNDVMFWKGGHLYVYFTYGMHFCSNVVTEEEGIPRAVLLRGLEPIKGVGMMRKNRDGAAHLTNGPARLCQAIGIGQGENGTDLCGTQIWLARDAGTRTSVRSARTRRIGITEGKEHRWRFFEKGNLYVSPGKPVEG